MERKASAVWEGRLRDGKGMISSDSGVLTNAEYSFGTRFENKSGTNPEELIAAAHAACFSMALSLELEKSGLRPVRIATSASAKLEKVGEEWAVTAIQLDTVASVPGAEKTLFDRAAESAKAGCPISRLLKADITLKAELESSLAPAQQSA